ncbi:MAG: methyltransferase dimerization domain-containing protein [Pseudolabrys sp.]
MTNVTPEPIMRISTGFMASKHLFTAGAIGLFEKLGDGTMTLDDLAAACGIPRRRCVSSRMRW